MRLRLIDCGRDVLRALCPALAPCLAGWFACAGLAAAPAIAQVGPSAAETAHVVRPGETLHALALRYMGEAGRWPQLQALNGVAAPHRLRPGTVLRIPAASPTEARATAAYVVGDVRYTPPGANESLPMQESTVVAEGTSIDVGATGFARLRMADGSLIRLSPGTRAQFSKLGRTGRKQLTVTSVAVNAGRVEASVLPATPKARRRFEIHAPFATASVRGTEFGVELHDDQSVTSEVTQGIVALRGIPRNRTGARPAAHRLLQAGQGARVDPQGRAGQVRALLGPPDLAALPAVATDADFVTLPLPKAAQASAYRVRVATDEALEQIVRSVTTTDSQARLAGLPDGSYTVGVRAIDSAGLAGIESQRALRVKAHPVAPLFQRPAPDEKVAADAVALSCTQPAEAQRFHLQVARAETFAELVVDEVMLAECRYEATLAPGHYVWRAASVRLLPDGTPDVGPFSSHQRFQVVTPAPNPPELTAGAADERLSIHWQGAPGLHYRVQVARDRGFSDLLMDEVRRETHVELSNQPAGTYYIRLRAIDAQGQEGPVSPAQAVHVTSVLRSTGGTPVRDSSGNAVQRP